MKRTLISCLISFAALFIVVSGAQAYEFYSVDTNDVGGCGQCHGTFRSGSYVSPADNTDWGTHLHNIHLNNTTIGSDCGHCHDGAGVAGRTVNLSSSAAAADGANAISCSGCHGRVEDVANGGFGAGLRLHHINAGAPADSNGQTCNDCHTDGTPVGEDIMPPWYGSVTNDVTGTTLNPCNVGGAENFAGSSLGNDNDGDLAYDGADSDCQAGGVCGDGTVDDGETCDDGGANGTTDCGCQTDCTLPAAGTSCADGEFCNGDETCDGAGTCDAGTAVVCDDGVGCTDDTCNETSDNCVYTPNNASCDDGLFCSGEEVCNPITDCSSPGDPCTPGTTCNEGTDTCDQPTGCTSDAECDNGLYCDGSETCNTTTGECLPGTPVDCADGVGCTVDICDEDIDACQNIPSDANCDNGQFCDGAETCDATLDCQVGTDPCAGDVCNETTDTCGATVCTDITAKETCNLTEGCSWFGKGKNGYCDDAPLPGDCSALGRKDCKADANCSWVNNQCVDFVPPTCSDFSKKNTCTSNGCTWDQGTGTCS